MIIEKLQLENFKCFKQTEIDFGKITLLTGANSSGKSSLIDALLAVMQTEQFPLYLSPNGKYKNMGGFENISHHSKNELIKISLIFPVLPCFKIKNDSYNGSDKWKIETSWQKSNKSAMPILNFLKSEFGKEEKLSSEIYLKNNKYILNSNYDNYYGNYYNNSYKNIEFEKLENIDIIGIHESLFGFDCQEGNVKIIENFELIFNYIHSFREEPQRSYYQVAKAKNRVSSSGNGYAQQIVEWEENEPDKIKLLTKYLQDLKLLHSIETVKRNDGTFQILVKIHKKSTAVPLTDVGYGVSKILPIIVADMQLDFWFSKYTKYEDSKINQSLLAVSEPEIDLHPSVQADFADYLKNQAIENQKQYIVETHSEYLINRLRLLIVRGELKEEDVKMYFFENNGTESTTFPIYLKKDGSIEGAPENFFKTYTIDIMEIALNSFETE